MNDKNISLETITEVQEGADAHIRANRLPVLTGTDEGDLNCGGCGQALATGITPTDFHQKIQTEQRLVVECTCGALNVIPR
jgi:hypothetical protein